MNATIEDRLVALEKRVAEIIETVDPEAARIQRLIDNMGWADDDPAYDEAMAEGRKYRESFRPDDYNADS